ncbi:MAG: heparinase II/III domain-containing protein [Planctomycetota bacterium]
MSGKHMICNWRYMMAFVLAGALLLMNTVSVMSEEEKDEKGASPGRPALLVRHGQSDTFRTVDELRRAIGEGRGRFLWEQVLETADEAVSSEPLTAFAPLEGRAEEDIEQGNSDCSVTNAAGRRVLSCALAYLVLEEEAYKEAALQQVETLYDEDAWPEWQDIHHIKTQGLSADLRTGQLSRDLGLAYDWLYSGLTEEEREWYVQGLDERGIQPYLQAVEEGAWWLDAMNNWTTVVVGGMGVCGMALRDEHPQSDRLIELAVPRMRRYLDHYGPNGEFNESPGYAGSSNNPVLFFSVYRYYKQHKKVPAEIAALRNHCIWQAYTIVPPGDIVPFGDGGPDRPASRNTYYFPAVAAATNDPVLQWFYLQYSTETSANPLLELLYYDKSVEPERPSVSEYPLGRAFPASSGIISSRTSWDQESAACTVMGKAGHGGVNHSHPDAGQVIIRGSGHRLIRDLGRVPYSYPKKNYYHFNSDGHNVLTFNDRDLIWKPHRRAAILSTGFDNEWGSYWTVDLTELYDEAEQVQRSVVHLFPGIVAVYDRADFNQKGKIRIRWHPENRTEPDENGQFTLRNGDAALTGLISSIRDQDIQFDSGKHRYEKPHNRDRMGNRLPQRNEPFMDALLNSDSCGVLSLFSVYGPEESPHPWEESEDGWTVQTPDGEIQVQRPGSDGFPDGVLRMQKTRPDEPDQTTTVVLNESELPVRLGDGRRLLGRLAVETRGEKPQVTGGCVRNEDGQIIAEDPDHHRSTLEHIASGLTLRLEKKSVDKEGNLHEFVLPLENMYFGRALEFTLQSAPDIGDGWDCEISPESGELRPGEEREVRITCSQEAAGQRYPLPRLTLSLTTDAGMGDESQQVSYEKSVDPPLIGTRPPIRAGNPEKTPGIDGNG